MRKLPSTVKAGVDKHPDVEAAEADIKTVVEWFVSKQWSRILHAKKAGSRRPFFWGTGGMG